MGREEVWLENVTSAPKPRFSGTILVTHTTSPTVAGRRTFNASRCATRAKCAAFASARGAYGQVKWKRWSKCKIVGQAGPSQRYPTRGRRCSRMAFPRPIFHAYNRDDPFHLTNRLHHS